MIVDGVDCGVLTSADVDEAQALMALRAKARTYFKPVGEDTRWIGYAGEAWLLLNRKLGDAGIQA